MNIACIQETHGDESRQIRRNFIHFNHEKSDQKFSSKKTKTSLLTVQLERMGK